MAYWLFKSEPGAWSWDQQLRKGATGEEWDGVRNHMAKNFMKEMTVGDLGFFYHSVDEKRIVGIVEVCAAAHPDSTDASGVWMCVDIRAVASMPKPVALKEIKADPRLETMALVRNPRLSVQPVRDDEWRAVCEMGGYRA